MERKSDENLKTQFKERWTQTPSSELNQNWKEHSFKYRSILHNAIEADNKVKQKFATHRDKMELLSSASPTTLANAIPSGFYSELSSCGTTQNIDINIIEMLKNEREVIEPEIKNFTFNDMKSKFLSALVKDDAIIDLTQTEKHWVKCMVGFRNKS